MSTDLRSWPCALHHLKLLVKCLLRFLLKERGHSGSLTTRAVKIEALLGRQTPAGPPPPAFSRSCSALGTETLRLSTAKIRKALNKITLKVIINYKLLSFNATLYSEAETNVLSFEDGKAKLRGAHELTPPSLDAHSSCANLSPQMRRDL